jgi:hypothetical protein
MKEIRGAESGMELKAEAWLKNRYGNIQLKIERGFSLYYLTITLLQTDLQELCSVLHTVKQTL